MPGFLLLPSRSSPTTDVAYKNVMILYVDVARILQRPELTFYNLIELKLGRHPK